MEFKDSHYRFTDSERERALKNGWSERDILLQEKIINNSFYYPSAAPMFYFPNEESKQMAEQLSKKKIMITIKCLKCGKEFEDYAGENCAVNDNGELIDYNRYYECPFCDAVIDLQENKVVDYDKIKDLPAKC